MVESWARARMERVEHAAEYPGLLASVIDRRVMTLDTMPVNSERELVACLKLVDTIAREPGGVDELYASELGEAASAVRERIWVDRDTEAETEHFKALVNLDDLSRLLRQTEELKALSRPDVAVRFITDTLFRRPSRGRPVAPTEVVGLLERRPLPGRLADRIKIAVDDEPERAAAIAKTIYFMKDGITPRGIVEWFDKPRDLLNGQTPRQLLDANIENYCARALPHVYGMQGQINT